MFKTFFELCITQKKLFGDQVNFMNKVFKYFFLMFFKNGTLI